MHSEKQKPKFSRRLSGLTCKGSLVQVHSSTPEKTVKPQGFSRFFVFVAPNPEGEKAESVNKMSTALLLFGVR
ncbi:MAG: hypothetical protein IKK06_07420 [Clostridia bacterium]|nr:hypothetical protein [Clostridia bacterium]